tara:strand:- start:1498 stop:3210 length:1713 start_codon:yes stop_codon:yes gene_type:complete
MRTFIKQVNFLSSFLPKSRYFLVVCLFFFTSILELLSIGILLPYISIIFELNNDFLNLKIIGLNLYDFTKSQLLLYSSVIVVFIFVIKNILIYYSLFYIASTEEELSKNLKFHLFKKFFDLPLKKIVEKNTSEFTNLIILQAKQFTGNVFINLLRSLKEIIFLFSASIMLISFSYYSFIMITFLSLILILIFIYSKNYTFKLGKISSENHLRSNKIISDAIRSFEIVNIFKKQSFFFDKILIAFEKIQTNGAKFSTFMYLPKLFMETLFVLIFALSLIFVDYFYNLEDLKQLIPILSVIIIAFIRLLPGVTGLSNNLSAINNGRFITKKLYDELNFFDEETNKNIKCNNTFKFKEIEKIELKNINFSYKEKKIINGLNGTYKKGDIVGIFGESGTGKSSICKIIMGLLDPNEGNIISQNKKIHEFKESWFDIIAYVPQKIFLLDDDIITNITLENDKKNIDYELLKNCILQSNLKEFIDKLPNKIFTKIGEDGSKISGGQNQRIAIARAIYKKPEVIIFDEATSSLDQNTEQEILSSILNISKDKIIFVVSHKYSTTKICNKIIDFNKIN